jgi:xanthine/CO dehydrogenase XdhC/CoxF family maturation factor
MVELLHNNIGLIAGKRQDLRTAMLAVRPTEVVAVRDVLDAIESWRGEGHRVALATVTKVKGSAPRPPGAKMAVSDDGRWVGSVSGGCVEGAVLEEAGRVLAGEPAHVVTFGITDEMVWDVGLACGGIIDVFVEPLP